MESEYTSPISKEATIQVLEELYRAKKNFPYSALAFILKPVELFNFLDYFGGTTIELPTKQEMTQLIQACLIKAVGDFDKAKILYKEVLHGLSKKQYDRILSQLD